MDDIARFEKPLEKNLELFSKLVQGEEGRDFVASPVEDPRLPDSALLEKQIRREINGLKITDPEKAREYEEFIFKRNEYDDLIAAPVDLSEVKVYPGSQKGPNPEDDVENYSRWFIENQPKSIYNGERTDFADIGAKRKYVQMVRDMSENNEQKTPMNYFMEEDEVYPLANYNGQPEFSIFERERYNVENDDELPSVSFSTALAPNELAPLPSEHTLNYQEVHYELERWTTFRGLPMMMQYDQQMLNFFKGLRQGTIRVPDFMAKVNPPSLFAYYETLPQWARDHPAVRNVLMAFEFHKPTLDIRQKEIAMNYAMSFIRPIDQELEDVIVEVATSTKIRMNVARGKEMINQLRFYEIDETTIGTDTESEEEMITEDQKMAKGVDEEEEELRRQRSAMENFASGLDEDAREREAAQIAENELSITQYQVEPEMEKVMTDFWLKPYADPREDPMREQKPMLQPINYYDNDDGFWDEYIKHKETRWSANPLIVNRPFLKH